MSLNASYLPIAGAPGWYALPSGSGGDVLLLDPSGRFVLRSRPGASVVSVRKFPSVAAAVEFAQAVSVRCPSCYSEAGEPCTDLRANGPNSGSADLLMPHKGRGRS